MIKKLLLVLFTFLSIHSYSQIIFEKGYYIDNNNKKVNCLIKNQDWLKTPKEFQYKLNEESQPQILTVVQVKEFAIDNSSKYERYSVNIDRSSELLKEMSYVKNPEFKEETLFLKVLTEGKATLYQYDEHDLKRFFFKTDTIGVNQLVYKSYKISEAEIGQNHHYKQQIANALQNSVISTKDIKNLSYNSTKLINIFSKYNQAFDAKTANIDAKPKKDLFNLNVRAGIKNSDLSITNSYTPVYDLYFDNKTGARLGIEAEFIFNFNKNKWAFIIEPTYQSYQAELLHRNYNAVVDYESIEIPVGFRYYSFLNDNSKLFVNCQYIVETQLGSKIDYQPKSELKVVSRSPIAMGIGYKFKNKYSLEFRYSTKKITEQHVYLTSNYTTTALIFGYTIF